MADGWKFFKHMSVCVTRFLSYQLVHISLFYNLSVICVYILVLEFSGKIVSPDSHSASQQTQLAGKPSQTGNKPENPAGPACQRATQQA
jgi:hypothetical protein